MDLPVNELSNKAIKEVINSGNLSNPYWLEDAYDGMFVVDDRNKIGHPEWNNLRADYRLIIGNDTLAGIRAIEFSWVDREKGELRRNTAVLPMVTLNMDQSVYVSSGMDTTIVAVNISSHKRIDELEVSPKFT